MESTLKDNYCSGCKSIKPLTEFISYKAEKIKQLKTCNNCHQIFEKKRKALVEIKNNSQPCILQVVDIDFLSEKIISLLNNTSSINNQELHLHYQINNISLTNNEISTKKQLKMPMDTTGKLANDVERYQRKRTMPLTWKGHTDNTRYFNV